MNLFIVMNKSRIFIGLILLIFFLFVFFDLSGYHTIALHLSSVMWSVIAMGYFLLVKKKSIYYSLFLILYAIADLVYLVDHYFELLDIVRYLTGNILYILSYACMLFFVFRSIKWKHIFKNFKIHFIVLTLLNIYMVHVLKIITNPHFGNSGLYVIEVIYNVEMLLLLSISLLNYFFRDNVKSLYIFIGSLCVVFSEVIGLAYWYVAHEGLLNCISITLTLLAFYFYYKQTKLRNTKAIDLREE